MVHRILTTLLALLTIVFSANAQSLSFEIKANEAKISLTGATEMTALQFNLQLPEGVSIDTSNATLGSATDGHTLCIETLDNGDLLFILYSMDLNTFKNGELLRIPVIACNEEPKLYTILFASTDAVSYAAEDVAAGIASPQSSTKGKDFKIYNLSGQRLNKMQKGINIVGEKKVLVK